MAQCPPFSIYDQNGCICNLPNQTYNETTNTCDCVPQTFKNSNGSCLNCPFNTFFDNGTCVCQMFEKFSESLGSCTQSQELFIQLIVTICFTAIFVLVMLYALNVGIKMREQFHINSLIYYSVSIFGAVITSICIIVNDVSQCWLQFLQNIGLFIFQYYILVPICELNLITLGPQFVSILCCKTINNVIKKLNMNAIWIGAIEIILGVVAFCIPQFSMSIGNGYVIGIVISSCNISACLILLFLSLLQFSNIVSFNKKISNKMSDRLGILYKFLSISTLVQVSIIDALQIALAFVNYTQSQQLYNTFQVLCFTQDYTFLLCALVSTLTIIGIAKETKRVVQADMDGDSYGSAAAYT